MQINRVVSSLEKGTRRQRPRGGSERLLPALTLLLLGLAGGGLIFRFYTLLAAPPAWDLTPQPATPVATPAALPLTPTPTALEAGDLLETLYLDLAPADFAQLVAKREAALQIGILLTDDTDYVPATLRLGQTVLPVKVRLKGDWTAHLASDKWSFRIRTKGDHYLYGMKVFSLQDPSMRSYLNEWLFYQNLRREGVLTVGYRFARVVLNGEYKGIYAIEEGFAKELLESQQRRAGVLIRYNEDLVWRYRAAYDDQLIPRGVNDFYVLDDFGAGSDPALAEQSASAIGLLRALWTGERAAAEVLDVETTGKFLALSDLWSAPHGLIWHNLRYYYNPVTARLEPVAFDSDALAGDLSLLGLPQSAFPYNFPMQRTIFYHDPVLQAAYVRELARISQPGYVEALEQQLGPDYERLRAALAAEFPPETLMPPWDTLRQRQYLARQILAPLQMTYAYLEPGASPSTTWTLRVGNLLDLPVELVGLTVGERFIPASRRWVPTSALTLTAPTAEGLVLRGLPPEATELAYLPLTLPAGADLPADAPVMLTTRLWGLTTTVTQSVLVAYPPPLPTGPLPPAPPLAEVLAQHPYLQVLSERQLTIPPGVWEIQRDLVLPAGYGLTLSGGTTLRFGAGTLLLVRGGPLDFQGTAEAPVLLQPAAESWEGLVVLEADAPSSWRYVTVERATAPARAGWALTGGITFYRSPIRLDHCRIVESRAEDGINVIQTRFEFVASEWAGTASDAFDADFATGLVERCAFHDTGGDAIDVSGSTVAVHDVRAFNIGDKGLSAGEQSVITATGFFIENCDFAVVSKDLSHVTLTGGELVAPRLAALAAYTKKPAYGPATLTATGVTFRAVPPERQTLVQTGSWIDLEGTRFWGTEVDVEALYLKWRP